MGEYYKLEEVMALLNKSKSTVLREAKAGLIPAEVKEGKQKGRMYPKRAIDALVDIQHARNKNPNVPKLVFSPSTPNDLWAEVVIGTKLYGEDDIVPFKQLLEWREVNDEMFMSLKEKGKVIAYTSLMPMDESIIQSLLRDEIRERDIPLNAIRQWTDPLLSVYVASVTVNPTGDEVKDSERGSLILRHLLKWALAMNEQYEIKNWYGIGATKKGQHLFEELAFKEIVSLYKGERKGYMTSNVSKPVRLIKQLLASMHIEAQSVQ